jgi:hypothetical protein
MSLSITTLGIRNNVECHFAEWHSFLIVILNVIMLSVVAPSFRLGWKGLIGANPLPHYDTQFIMIVKSFRVQAPGANVIKLFCP